MTIDLRKLRVGDFVTLRQAGITRIDHILSRPVEVKYPSGATGWVHFADIATHIPKPKVVEVGDKVMRGIYGPFEVLALHERYAWIERVSDKIVDTALISTLIPCEAPHD